jgi:hypothetical protein
VPRTVPFDAIDHVLALDLGGRGIGAFFIPGAAEAAARALLGARRVLIVTGFCVPPGIPETDGPLGSAVLGRALRRLGARVRYVTDPSVEAPMAATLGALGEPADIETHVESRALLARERPTHLVAIERPGRARNGDYLSARGESIAAWNAPLDELFVPGARGGAAGGRKAASGTRGRGVVTVGVGDGGNEIGMGNVRRRLAREGELMARIASTVTVDHLVVAGASNWGAYGIVAALSRLTGQPLLHSPGLERAMLEACVKAGAVDGITRKAEPTVDGLPAETHQAIVELLAHAVPELSARRGLIRARAGLASPPPARRR